jgi:hypothetical protein
MAATMPSAHAAPPTHASPLLFVARYNEMVIPNRNTNCDACPAYVNIPFISWICSTPLGAPLIFQNEMEGGARHHHLVEYTHPHSDIRTVTECVVLTCDSDTHSVHADRRHDDGDGGFRACGIALDSERRKERGILLRLEMLYTLSDLDEPLEVEAYDMFDERAGGEGVHPDFTGTVRFAVAGGGQAGVIAKHDRLIYEPNFLNLGVNLLPFVGAEHHILEARSSCVSSDENHDACVFSYTDPLVVFLMAHRAHFRATADDDIVSTTRPQQGPVYAIRRALVRRVQDFFRTAVYPQIRHVRAGGLRFRLPQAPCKAGTVVMMLRADYLVVSARMPQWEATTLQLNV